MAPTVLKLAAAGDDRGHQSGSHPYGQSVAVPLPAPNDNYFRPRESPITASTRSQEKMGDRSFDRRIRTAGGKALAEALGKLGAPAGSRSGATPTKARISRRSCWL